MSKLVNNENKKMIVEFSHPGKEYIPYKRKDDPNVVFDNKSRDIGKRKWNNLFNYCGWNSIRCKLIWYAY